MAEKDVMNTEEAAAFLGTSPYDLRRWPLWNSHRFPSFRAGIIPRRAYLGMPLRQDDPNKPKTRPLSKGRRKKRRVKTMPKAAAAPQVEVKEPFIPEDTAAAALVNPLPELLPEKPAPKCKKHPDRDAKINSRGISTGQCEE